MSLSCFGKNAQVEELFQVALERSTRDIRQLPGQVADPDFARFGTALQDASLTVGQAMLFGKQVHLDRRRAP